MNEEAIFVDQVEGLERAGELVSAEKNAARRPFFDLRHRLAEITFDEVRVGPRIVAARGRHDVLRFGVELDRPLAHRGGCLGVAGDGGPCALHHLVRDSAPEHRRSAIYQRRPVPVKLVVREALAMIDAAVEGDVDAEGEEAHTGDTISYCRRESDRSRRGGRSRWSARGPRRRARPSPRRTRQARPPGAGALTSRVPSARWRARRAAITRLGNSIR